MMAVYFISKIALSQPFVLKNLSEFNTRFLGNSKVVLLNPFLFKHRKVPDALAKLKALQRLPQQSCNRILFVPLHDFKAVDHYLSKGEFQNRPETVSQINGSFDKEASFAPLLSNLVVLIKGQKPKFSESEITSKVITKVNFLGNSRLGKLNTSVRSHGSVNKTSSASFEFGDKDRQLLPQTARAEH